MPARKRPEQFEEPVSPHEIIERSATEEDSPWRTGYISEEYSDLISGAVSTLHDEEHKRIGELLPLMLTDIRTLRQLSLEARVPVLGLREKLVKTLEEITTTLTSGKPSSSARPAISFIAGELSKRIYSGRAETFAPEEIHALARIQSKSGIPLTTEFWIENKHLNALYAMIRGRDSQGRRIYRTGRRSKQTFFGTGSFHEYWLKYHDLFVPISTTFKLPDATERTYRRKGYYFGELHDLVRQKLDAGASPGQNHWRTNPELQPLFRGVRNRTIHAKNFSGYGTWKRYVTMSHLLASDEVHRLIREKLGDTRVELNATFWRKNPDLRIIYNRVREKMVLGKSFFGYGSWNDYLELHHSAAASPLKHPGYSDAEIHSLVREKLRDPQTKRNSWYWQKTPGLAPIYAAVRRRERNGKTFFGYGKWHEYVKGYHGAEATPRRRTSILPQTIHADAEEVLKRLNTLDSWLWNRDKNGGRVLALLRRRGSGGRILPRDATVSKAERYLGHGSLAAYLRAQFPQVVERSVKPKR